MISQRSLYLVAVMLIAGGVLYWIYPFSYMNSKTNPIPEGYVRLTEYTPTIGWGKEAVAAIEAKLRSAGENPAEFYVEWHPAPAQSQLTFLFIHEDELKPENRNSKGSPSGKSREAIYDLGTKEVTFVHSR